MRFKHIRRHDEHLPPIRTRPNLAWQGYEQVFVKPELELELGPGGVVEHVFRIAKELGWEGTMYEWYVTVKMDRSPNFFGVRYYWPKYGYKKTYLV